MSTSRGKFIWYDVMTNNTEGASLFNSDLIGRVAEKHAMPDIAIPQELQADGTRPCWFGYFGTDDIDSDAGRIWAAGGTIMRPPQDIPNVGRFAVVSDPGGAVFLLFQSNTEVQPKPVAPLSTGHVGQHAPLGGQAMSDITPCLWFDGNAEEAAIFYASLLPNSRVDAVHRAPSDYPSGHVGDVLMVEFTLMGRPFAGLNGGSQFQFNEAVSFQIPVETQAEVDRLTEALSAVPEAEQCGWVKDRFGLSWQIIPRQLSRLIVDPDPARAKRAFEAMMEMKRIDIGALERAADGAAPSA